LGKVYRVGLGNSMMGKIDGGGPELVFKNMNKNIYTQK